MDKKEGPRKLRDQLIEQARQMRAEPTPAEAHLWKKLRKRQVGGFKFRRQHIIHTFIVDFYCPEARLVIEIDGPVHRKQVEYDRERKINLKEMGYRVLRFCNENVFGETELVIADIYDACMKSNSPSGEGKINK